MSTITAGNVVAGHVAEERAGDRYDVEIVVPVYNEQDALDRNVRRLRRYLDEHMPFPTLVTIGDNASTDMTPAIAAALAAELRGVRAVRLEGKGRGRALRAIWTASRSSVVAYMDVDLSTDLDALLPLVAPLLSGHSDVAIGTRLAPGSRVVRGARRETISRSYNGLLHLVLRTRFSDAQCGFKAVRADVARLLLPLVEDDAWFFDTELLVLAERSGCRIHEVPVDWVDDSDSRVDVARTALEDLRGMSRMVRRIASPRLLAAAARSGRPELPDDAAAELVRFAAIGSGSTLAYLALFLALRSTIGAVGANVVALLLCSIGNRVAHRRAAAGTQSRSTFAYVAQTVGGGLAVSLVLTTASLLVAARVSSGSVPVELVALLVATGAATIVRFTMLRHDIAVARRS